MRGRVALARGMLGVCGGKGVHVAFSRSLTLNMSSDKFLVKLNLITFNAAESLDFLRFKWFDELQLSQSLDLKSSSWLILTEASYLAPVEIYLSD